MTCLFLLGMRVESRTTQPYITLSNRGRWHLTGNIIISTTSRTGGMRKAPKRGRRPLHDGNIKNRILKYETIINVQNSKDLKAHMQHSAIGDICLFLTLEHSEFLFVSDLELRISYSVLKSAWNGRTFSFLTGITGGLITI